MTTVATPMKKLLNDPASVVKESLAGLAAAHGDLVRYDAEAHVDAGLREQRPDSQGAERAAHELRGPISRHLVPRNALRRRERERHGGVDVTAGDLADRVDEGGDHQAERE